MLFVEQVYCYICALSNYYNERRVGFLYPCMSYTCPLIFMDWIIFVFVVTWLGIVSWFDIRKNEIPHSAWVVIPLIGAGLYRIWQGDWTLVLLAAVVAAVSERDRISQAFGWEELSRIITWLPLLFLGGFLSIQSSPLSALAIIAFWAAWELMWWGGADAVAAIAIILIYPEIAFILDLLS